MAISHLEWLFVCVFLVVSVTECVPEEPEKTFGDFFFWGKTAYSEERWYECTAFMKRALEDYKYERSITVFCRKKCQRLMPSWDYSYAPPTSELKYLDRILKKSLCLQRCRIEKFGPRPNVRIAKEELDEYDRMEPYHFLQLCYWKLGDLEHAVSAAYTYLTRNPGHQIMSENLQFYSKQNKFSEDMLKNLEIEEYQKLYMEGANAYDAQDYMEVIDKFEKGLEDYWLAHEDCRLECESHFFPSNIEAPEFYVALGRLYGDVLACKTNCSRKLNMIRGNYIADFIPSHFHYLQFAYWKNSQTKKACEAVATYLLFYPEDDTMLYNKKFYRDTFDLEEVIFTPRKDVLRHYKRQILESRLLNFIQERMVIEDETLPNEKEEDYQAFSDELLELGKWGDLIGDPENLLNDKQHEQKLIFPEKPKHKPIPRRGDTGALYEIADEIAEKLFQAANLPPEKLPKKSSGFNSHTPGWQPSKSTLSDYEKEFGIKVLKKEEELNGNLRFVAEKLLTTEECKKLMGLEKLARLGNGYAGKASPHTKNEEFRGLTATEISQLAAERKLDLETAKLLMDKSELARDFVESYFNLSTHLFFDYTHFVCRDAIPGKSDADRTDLSHPVHGDNCLLKNGRCVKEFPAYTWRDYSSIIFLNEEFKGGEFIFTDIDKNIQAELTPHCGHMVAFSGETPHGVKALMSGTRCVMAQWMTLDPKHQETERLQAQQVLAQLEWESENTSTLDEDSES